MYRVILWGMGNGYDDFVSHRGLDMVDVVAIIDKEKRGYKKIDGIPVISPEEFEHNIRGGILTYDFLIITMLNEGILKQVVNEAMRLGVSRDVILPLRIFDIPFFDFEKYITIKKSKVSIISDYCFAAYLYYRFGFAHNSPTINMYADNENYYNFIVNIEENMKKTMTEIENNINEPYKGIYAFPRGRIGLSEWNFNHDATYETALERWKRGAERFNYDNYIVIMSIMSDDMAYRFNALSIKHKIGFYWKDLGLGSVVFMPEWNIPEIRKKCAFDFTGLVNRVANGVDGIRTINWMEILLHEEHCRRIEFK